jgi:ferritin-like metal-binding protein YciE
MQKSTKTTRTAKSNGTQSKSSGSQSKQSAGSRSKQSAEKKSKLEEFFIEELKDIYWAEKHLTKALPKMQKASTSEELASAFADHLTATEEHVSRLEEAFEMMGETPKAKKCEAMEGLVKEAEELIEDTEDDTSTRDVGLILGAQKVEHYEIATYGGLITLAGTLGRDDVAELLKQTLAEEKEADELLTSIAESNVNNAANTEGANEEEDVEDEEEEEEEK